MKMREGFFTVLLVLVSIVFLSEAAAKENLSTRQCIRGLLKAQQLIDDRNISISKRYLKGKMGWLMLKKKFNFEDFKATKAGELKDIHACLDIELWPASSHTIIMNALSGFYENGGKDILNDCLVAIRIIEKNAISLFGDEVGKKIGFKFGAELGIATSMMGYLFTEHPYDLKEIMTRSGIYFLRFNKMQNKEKKLISENKFMNSCSKIGIDAKFVAGILSLAGQGGRQSSPQRD